MNQGDRAEKPPGQMSESEELTRKYWNLREEVRRDEGRLQELNNLIRLIHNVAWK